VEDAKNADVLHAMVLPHVDQAPIGAIGSMATALGLLDATAGRYDDALRWFDLGHQRNISMTNRAFAALTLRERAAALLARNEPGDRAAAREILEPLTENLRADGFTGFLGRAQRLLHAATDDDHGPSGRAALRREGSSWLASYGRVTVHIAHSKGVADIAVLLERPGQEVAAVDLARTPTTADTGEILDARARRELRARVLELEDDVADAEAAGDIERAARARADRDAIVDHLAAALGLGGRPRRGGDQRERARKAVTWRIRQAIRAIGAEHPALGAHLDRSVRTGTFCSYTPDEALLG
jgi:hypothetical protein